MQAPDYLQMLVALLPSGPLWARFTAPGTLAYRLLDSLSEEFARIDARARALVDECDPLTTVELLSDWEQFAGLPDACVASEQTSEQRHSALVSRLNGETIPTPTNIIAAANAAGYDIELTEYRPHHVDDDVMVPLYTNPWAHALGIRGPRTAVEYATVADHCLVPLASWGVEALECAVDQVLHAHMAPIYRYGWDWDGAWFEVSAPTGRWYDMAWSPELGLFVAVGYTVSGGGNLVATSPDGEVWTVQSAPVGDWSGVAWSPEVCLFVAIGYSYLDYPVVMTSPDGETWTAHSAPPGGWSHLIWVADLGLFLATGYADPEYTAMTSPDGETWTGVYSETDLDGGLCWNPDRGELLALDYIGTHVYISRDTRSWTSVGTIGAPGYVNVLYHAAAQLYVAFSLTQQPQPANGAVWTSPDGQVWSPCSTPDGAWADGIYVDAFGEVVLVGYGGAIRSFDTVTWESVTAGLPDLSPDRWSCIGWSPELRRLAALSDALGGTAAVLSTTAT